MRLSILWRIKQIILIIIIILILLLDIAQILNIGKWSNAHVLNEIEEGVITPSDFKIPPSLKTS